MRNSNITPDERIAAYRIGRSTIYKLMAEGKLGTVKIGKRRLIPRDNMETLLREGA